MPQTLDEVKAQFYKTNTVDNINSLIDQYKSIEAQAQPREISSNYQTIRISFFIFLAWKKQSKWLL